MDVTLNSQDAHPASRRILHNPGIIGTRAVIALDCSQVPDVAAVSEPVGNMGAASLE